MIAPWKMELIASAAASDAFPSKDKPLHRKVLEHLAEHSSPQDRSQRTERFLEEKFLPAGYGGKVPTFISRLAHALETYFASEEGQRHPYRIEILRGKGVPPSERYAVRFSVNPNGLLRLFWRPYLDVRAVTFIAYGVPLFFRSADQTVFLRQADINVPGDAPPEKVGEICWPFVAHGDLLAANEVNRWLASQGVMVNFASFKADDGFRTLGHSTSNDANVVVLGSTRVNGILQEYQRLEIGGPKQSPSLYLPFRLRLYDVVRVDENEQPVGNPYAEEHGARTSSVPVVITRRPGMIRNWVTMIASNHGRAVHRAAQILTNANELHELFGDERLRGWIDNLPSHFQLVLRVTVLAHEEMAGAFSLDDVWSYD